MKKIAWVLIIIGALNWGLVGLGMLLGGANWNIVSLVFGGSVIVEALVYILVATSAIVFLFAGSKCKDCKDGSCAC